MKEMATRIHLMLSLCLTMTLCFDIGKPTPQQVIIDTDPAGLIATGMDVDDDLAIISALSMNRTGGIIHVLGLTITAGNTQLTQAYADALELRDKLGIPKHELPIHPGAHNHDWLPFNITSSKRVAASTNNYTETKAAQFIVDTIMNAPSKAITILSLGPLTNIATALQMQPQIAKRIKYLVTMGGIIHQGCGLDLNFRFDKRAASIVMRSQIPKVLIPVETAIQAVFGSPQIEKIVSECDENDNNNLAVCSFLWRMHAQRHVMPIFVNRKFQVIKPQSPQLQHGFVLWDVVALYAVTNPEMFNEWKQYDIEFASSSKATTTTTTSTSGLLMTLVDEKQEENSYDILPTTSSTNINRVTVPMILRDEKHLQDQLHFHLTNGHPTLPVHMKQHALTFWISLGLLQYIIFLLVGVTIIITFLLLTFLLLKSTSPSQVQKMICNNKYDTINLV